LAKWEYIVLALKTKVHVSRHEREKNPTIQNVQNELNALGEKGWELVSVQNIRLETGMLFTVAYLKRKKLGHQEHKKP
jgi:ribosomal protein S24E